MAFESLQAMVGNAVVDERFRCALLGASRLQVLLDFHLTFEETKAVMAIRAETLEQFASQVHSWIMKQQGQVEPPGLTTALRASAASPPEHEGLREHAPARDARFYPAWVS